MKPKSALEEEVSNFLKFCFTHESKGGERKIIEILQCLL